MISVRAGRSPQVGLTLGLVCASATAAWAQDIQVETTTNVPKREQAIQDSIRKAAAEAEMQSSLETDEVVTYQQILADPDNPELNFKYAQTQIAQGNYKGASATLERMLMIDPDIVRVRLYYAIVLYRLENFEEAEREFNRVSRHEMPETLQAELNRYMGEIQKRRKRTAWTSNTTVGFQWDSNRNAAASSKVRFLSDTPLALTGTSKKRRDTSMLIVKSISMEHDVGSQEGHLLTGSLDYYLGEQTSADDLDLASYSFTLGGVWKNKKFGELTPSATVSTVGLSRETYLQTQGLGLKYDKLFLDNRLSLSVSGDWTREDYLSITENATAPERTGDHYSTSIGSGYVITPTTRLAADFSFDKKDAKLPYNAYDGYTVSGTHTWVLGSGQFLLNNLEYVANFYHENDASISVRTRRDDQLRYRLTYGAPVAFLFGERFLPDAVLENLTATVSYEQFRSLSNITNYTYTNSKFSTMISKRIDF